MVWAAVVVHHESNQGTDLQHHETQGFYFVGIWEAQVRLSGTTT